MTGCHHSQPMSLYLGGSQPCPFCALARETGRRERLLALRVASRCTCEPLGTVQAASHAAGCPGRAEIEADAAWEPPEPEPVRWMTPEEFAAQQKAEREAQRVAKRGEEIIDPIILTGGEKED